jgi:hypothetical protein
MRLGLCLPDRASPPRRRASARRPFSSASAIVDLCSPKGWLSDAGSKKDVSRCSCRYGLSDGRCIRPAGAFSSPNAGASSGGPAASPARTRPLVLVTRSLAMEWRPMGLGVRTLAALSPKRAPMPEEPAGGQGRWRTSADWGAGNGGTRPLSAARAKRIAVTVWRVPSRACYQPQGGR